MDRSALRWARYSALPALTAMRVRRERHAVPDSRRNPDWLDQALPLLSCAVTSASKLAIPRVRRQHFILHIDCIFYIPNTFKLTGAKSRLSRPGAVKAAVEIPLCGKFDSSDLAQIRFGETSGVVETCYSNLWTPEIEGLPLIKKRKPTSRIDSAVAP